MRGFRRIESLNIKNLEPLADSATFNWDLTINPNHGTGTSLTAIMAMLGPVVSVCRFVDTFGGHHADVSWRGVV
jgi:hypothetical protein